MNKFRTKGKKEIKGIALIQVLIITMVLTILGIFISQSIRSQVNLSFSMQTAVKLELMVESAQAQLLHALLANERYPNSQSENLIVKNWNFYNQAFPLNDDVQVKLQDANGLLGLNMMSHELARKAFAELGLEGHPVRTFLDSLRDWIDEDSLKYLNGAERDYYRQANLKGPRNGYLQSLDEVQSIKMGNILPFATWQMYFTEQLTSGFNPLNAPPLLLKALVGDQAIVDKVLLLRKEKQLNLLRFYQVTGIDSDEYINFATGRRIRVELLAKIGNQQMRKKFVVELRSYDPQRTVIITDISWNKQ